MSSTARFHSRELLCIVGAQHHVRVDSMLGIEEWMTPDYRQGGSDVIGAVWWCQVPAGASGSSQRSVKDFRRAVFDLAECRSHRLRKAARWPCAPGTIERHQRCRLDRCIVRTACELDELRLVS